MAKTYSELLKDPRWQKKRLEILNRDNFTCQLCFSSTKTLHIHHLEYEGSTPWETAEDKLITLCEGCHKKIEEIKGQCAPGSTFSTKIENLLKVTIYQEMFRDDEFFETLRQIYRIRKLFQDKREQAKILSEDEDLI